jgi:7-cyano-7-deazaguanine synthase in queuosine biosynthesis
MIAEHGWEVHSLFINWNPHLRPKGFEASAATAAKYCKTHQVQSYSNDWICLTPLQNNKVTTQYATMTSTMLGLQYAAYLGAEYVINGSRKDVYPDEQFGQKFMDLVNGNRVQSPRLLLFPVFNLTNEEVHEKAKSLGVSLDTTWSCSVYPACGTCNGCIRRSKYIE